MSDTSLMDSLKSLVSPKTIPFLISQGVVPKLIPVVTATIGLILGFIWAYWISPAVYVGAGPVNLSDQWKQEYIKQVAWQYSAYSQVDPAGAQDNAKKQLSYLGDSTKQLSALMAQPAIQSDTNLMPRLQAIQPFAADNPSELNKVTPGFFGTIMPVLCVLAFLLIPGLAVVVNTIIPITLLFQPKSKAASTASPVEKARRDAIDAALKAKDDAAKTAPAAEVQRGTPVGQYMSTYIMGDDLYDDSFAIETPSGEFLGETGAGISKTIGVGDPKKVTAIEVWVFDKTDIKTLTKVLMSEHAYNDEAIRAELAPKGEAVLVKPGAVVLLESQALTVQARVVDLAYGSGSLPPNSFYERFTIEILAWPKAAGEATAGAGTGAAASGGSASGMFSSAPTPQRPGSDAFGDTGMVGRQ